MIGNKDKGYIYTYTCERTWGKRSPLAAAVLSQICKHWRKNKTETVQVHCRDREGNIFVSCLALRFVKITFKLKKLLHLNVSPLKHI